MPAFFSRHRLLILALGVAAVAVLAAVLTPWKPVAERGVKAMLEAQGFRNVRLTVSDLGFGNIALKDISIGEREPLVLKNLTLDYSLAGLLSGRFGEMTLSGLEVEGRQEGGRWIVKGLEGVMQARPQGGGFALPADADRLIPFERARLEDSSLHLSNVWELSVPLDVSWQKKPVPEFAYRGTDLVFKTQALEITTGETEARLALQAENKQWQGSWRLRDMAVKGAAMPLPPLDGTGEIIVRADTATVAGRFASADNSCLMEFKLDYAPNTPAKSQLALIEVALPWNEGRLSVRGILLPLDGKRDISFPIAVERVSVNALMQSLTGKRASGTGLVSGTLPVTVRADGTILLQKGDLRAEAPGVIALSPEAIPGDNEQVALVREILKDLHYTLLSISMESGPEQKSSILMTLEGRNPAVYDGRPVKLNLRLTGDVLNLVQQSIMPMLDPRLLLKQDKHEKN